MSRKVQLIVAAAVAGVLAAMFVVWTVGATSSSVPGVSDPLASNAELNSGSGGTVISPRDWPDASDTGTAECGRLSEVDNENEVNLDSGAVLENTQLLNPAVIQVRGPGVTIRCVKFSGGTGYFGIDNTHYSPTGSAASLVVDRVEIDCKNGGQLTGLLVQSATISRVNVHQCEDGFKIGGNDVVIRESYCHDLTNIAVAHSDCIQSYGDNRGLTVEQNSLWGRDTSDILMGREGGDSMNVVIHNNRFMSVGTPPPAFLLYVSGTNTVVTDNSFSRRSTYGACTVTTDQQVTWSGNTWDDDGSSISMADCR